MVEVILDLLGRWLAPAQRNTANRHRHGGLELPILPNAGVDADHEIGLGHVQLDGLGQGDQCLVGVVPDVHDVGICPFNAGQQRGEVRRVRRIEHALDGLPVRLERLDVVLGEILAAEVVGYQDRGTLRHRMQDTIQ